MKEVRVPYRTTLQHHDHRRTVNSGPELEIPSTAACVALTLLGALYRI